MLRMLCVVGLALTFVGCSDGTVDVETTTVEPTITPAKKILDEIIESGVIGSGAMSLRTEIELAGPSEEVLKALDELENASNPNEVKAKAKALSEML